MPMRPWLTLKYIVLIECSQIMSRWSAGRWAVEAITGLFDELMPHLTSHIPHLNTSLIRPLVPSGVL